MRAMHRSTCVRVCLQLNACIYAYTSPNMHMIVRCVNFVTRHVRKMKPASDGGKRCKLWPTIQYFTNVQDNQIKENRTLLLLTPHNSMTRKVTKDKSFHGKQYNNGTND